MSIVRLAIDTDKDQAVALLHASHLGAGFDRADGPTGFVVPFEPAYAERLFLMHVRSPRMICLAADDRDGVTRGVLLAAAYEHRFGPVWIASETAWWIDPAHRGGSAAPRMLDAYEDWARRQGCVFAGMAGMGGDPQVAKLYLRRGYQTAETHFLKAL
ncbi:GCN5-related N-acetyltransferase [Rhodopseudomonas palustris TIE-1]|uniref:GNAT family N-acetyltransferase n=1 Tax=Rhodopseudomonas palustris TaxID=1076 RepID=UPI000164A51E|nr:GNAT family N-acetyltransferase [Rhodopseudomonas palustris]ACF01845.1 GCN5-related N-acetyltransferase [Rhodopseudomonas palustris TIE-1]